MALFEVNTLNCHILQPSSNSDENAFIVGISFQYFYRMVSLVLLEIQSVNMI